MEIGESSNLILVTLAIYFLTIIGMSLFYSRRAKSTDDFILASHSLSTPFVTGSVVATWLGGAVILGGAKEAYVGGFQAIVWDPWSPVLTLLFCGFLGILGIFYMVAAWFSVAASSAIVSTAGDTVLTSGALLGYTALRAIKPNSTDRQCLLATRIAMLAFTATGLLFGLAMGNHYCFTTYTEILPTETDPGYRR